jgi:hypothetical protein
MHKPTSRFLLWPTLAFAAYACLYFSLIYHPGLVRMDDFGYLQGVVDTLAQGRLRTGEWLQPYSATMTALCALAYLLTGDFPWSTWGVEALFALANFLLLYRLLRGRLDSKQAAALALVMASQPVYWHKCSEFAGNVFGITFALLAWLAYLRKRPFAFFLAAFLANRQNNLALLALPGFHFLAGGWPSAAPEAARRDRLRLGLGFAAFFLAAAALHICLNRTYAQGFGVLPARNLATAFAVARALLVGGFACLAILSAFSLLTGDSPWDNLKANLRRPWLAGSLTLAFLAIPFIGSVQLLSFLTPLVGSLDHRFQLQWLLVGLIPALLWVLDYRQIRWDAPALLVLGFIAASGIKGFWYDFYLVDPALATLGYRLTRQRPLAMGTTAWAIASLMLAGHILWGYGYKILGDKQMLALSAYERLERSGALGPGDMSDASFGYAGWKLFEHIRGNRKATELVDFLCYLNLGKVVVESELPWRRGLPFHPLPARILEAGRARIGYFDLGFQVVDKQGTEAVPYCPGPPWPLEKAGYLSRPFPLDAQEWSSHIAASRARFLAASRPQSRPGMRPDPGLKKP